MKFPVEEATTKAKRLESAAKQIADADRAQSEIMAQWAACLTRAIEREDWSAVLHVRDGLCQTSIALREIADSWKERGR